MSTNEIQQYYPIDKTASSVIDSSNDSRITSSGIRNGFRPSTVRHQKSRITTPRTNQFYDNKELIPKSAYMSSQTSAKLKSDINQINNKLTKQSSKSFRLPNSRVIRKKTIENNLIDFGFIYFFHFLGIR